MIMCVDWHLKRLSFVGKKGLCFHYKEKYTRGHSCEKKQLLLTDVQGPEEIVAIVEENLEPDITTITTYALLDTPAPKPIKL